MSTPTTAIAVPDAITPDKVELLKRTICAGATDDEFELFVGQCRRTGLDPFSRQIHAVKRWDSQKRREVMAIQVGIDGFRLVAQRTREADGQDGPYWCGPDGAWKDVWLAKAPPAAAKVTVFRRGHARGYVGVARWDSYCQRTKEGAPTRMWGQMSDVMLAKVAEALALRKAFPQELSGLYTGEEMAQAEEPREEPPAPTPQEVRSLITSLAAELGVEYDAAAAKVWQGMGFKAEDETGLTDDERRKVAPAIQAKLAKLRAEAQQPQGA